MSSESSKPQLTLTLNSLTADMDKMQVTCEIESAFGRQSYTLMLVLNGSTKLVTDAEGLVNLLMVIFCVVVVTVLILFDIKRR